MRISKGMLYVPQTLYHCSISPILAEYCANVVSESISQRMLFLHSFGNLILFQLNWNKLNLIYDALAQ